MRIVRKDDAQSFVFGETSQNEIHHAMAISNQVLPEKLAPQVADYDIVERHTALAMDVADDVVIAQEVIPQRRQQRADVTTAIWNDVDEHRSSIVAAGSGANHLRLALIIGGEHEIALRAVDP